MRPFWLQGRKPYYPEKPLISRLLRRRIRPPTVERGTRTHRPLRRCPPGAWSCRKQVLGRSTPRPLWLIFRPQPAQEPPAAFSAAGRYSTAADPVLAALLSALPAARQEQASTLAVHVPNTPRAPAPAVTLEQVRRVPPEPVPDSALAPASDPLAPVAHPVPAAHRQPASPHARSVHHPEAAADARSIQKLRKAR
jgi:hypothetical protein